MTSNYAVGIAAVLLIVLGWNLGSFIWPTFRGCISWAKSFEMKMRVEQEMARIEANGTLMRLRVKKRY